MPKVSVIMPAYNMEKYIAQSIESVLSQNYQDWELLIVDDGSTDQTKAICETYLKDNRVKYFYKPNGGLPSARNHAIERAQGELLALLDSDDLWLPSKLSESVIEFQNGEQDLLFTSFYKFRNDNDVNHIDRLQKCEVGNQVFHNDAGIKTFIKGNKIHTPTVVVKKDAVIKLGGFPNLSFAEDRCMWLLLLINGYQIRSIDKALSLYRVSEQSMYHSAKNIQSRLFRVHSYIITRHPDFVKYQTELRFFLKCYIALDYDRSKENELKHIMKTLNIKSPLANGVLKINTWLPQKIENKLLRIMLSF